MINFAIVGCGRVAKFHLEAILETKGAELKAISDLDFVKANKLVQSSPNAKIYTDYREMLLDSSIDVVSICTNHHLHFEVALAALEAGKHIIVEKPVTLSLEDADRLIEAQKKNGVKATVVFQNRFNQAVELVKRTMDEGLFGKLSHGVGTVRWCRDQAYYDQDAWRGSAKEKDGFLMNQSIHTIDLLTYLMGPVKKVTGQVRTAFSEIEMEDVGLATIEFENGAIGQFEGAGTIYPDDLEASISLFGSKGSVILGGMSANQIKAWRFKKEYQEDQARVIQHLSEKEAIAPTVYGFGHEKIVQDMVSSIKDNREPKIRLEDGKHALAVVLAIYQSAENGGMPVYLTDLGQKTSQQEIPSAAASRFYMNL